jgi:carbamate kinase
MRAHVEETCRALARVVAAGWRVVVTHGNGPQVGAELIRSELAAREAYPLPLDVCVASTQGEIGFLLQQALGAALGAAGVRRPVATVLAQVAVARDDPGFARPTKPIGPFYSRTEAEARRSLGWVMVEVPPHGYRRVVASPEPLEIVEEPVIRTLAEAGIVVITLGGGGIPVVRNAHRLTGIEAVVDKDASSALLAIRLQVDRLVLATDVDRLYLDFGTASARGLDRVTCDDLRRLAAAGHFPPGTMGPKVDAAIRFVEAGGREAIIAAYDALEAAIAGGRGTHVEAVARGAEGSRSS